MYEKKNFLSSVGVVIIGRNEGDRLKRCLESIVKHTSNIVYVDSGSSDDSIKIAHILGVDVICLDLSKPFTAARARNEGYDRLIQQTHSLAFVQFVDGDCEIKEQWLGEAIEYLNQNSNVAVVCGRLRERYPENSIYNTLCDIEWNTPVGEAKACGGIALMRTDVFEQVAGFNPNIIAGEEPELCLRIRKHGWKIWRINVEMAMHDANMTYFSQWWKRSVRGGYAYALGAAMHGDKPERHWVNEINRIRLWGLYIPISLFFCGFINSLFLYGLLIYPLQIIRLAVKYNNCIPRNWSYAFFLTLGKFPEAQGQIKYLLDKIMKTRSKIIEYKKSDISQ